MKNSRKSRAIYRMNAVRESELDPSVCGFRLPSPPRGRGKPNPSRENREDKEAKFCK
jgi:hypothetical protein